MNNPFPTIGKTSMLPRMTLGYWIILAGLILIGVGTFLGFYGAQLNNRADNAGTAAEVNNKIADVFAKIAAAQSEVVPSASASVTPAGVTGTSSTGSTQARETIDDVREDFAQWASHFTQNRSAKRLELDRLKVDARSDELKISGRCRPIFQRTIQILREAITAYDRSAGTDYKVELRDLPDNLYETAGDVLEVGTIRFSAEVTWKLTIAIHRPPRDDSPPVFYFNMNNSAPGQNDVFRIEVGWDSDQILLRSSGGGIAGTAKIDGYRPLADYDGTLRKAFQRLLEAQISSLGPTP